MGLLRALVLVPGLLALLCGAVQAGQVKYVMWDSRQLPAYRQCAADFMKKNPGTTVRITQTGWGDYWTMLSTGFIAEYAPDVFVNHASKYPEYAVNGLIEDLTPYMRRDALDVSAFPPALMAVWARDGRQYGLPKDWDTVALMVNLAHARKAGVTLAELQDLRWNPRDGGSFEQVIKRLTLDVRGRNALSPDFDRTQVAVHGYQNPGPGAMSGQTEWSHFAGSAGFRFQDRPWAWPLRYDDPRLAETVDWLAGLEARGLSAPYAQIRSLGAGPMFVAGRAAMVPDGAWKIGYFAANAKFEHTWVPLPRGPSGRRATILNGLADSMWAGSKVKEEAWAWIRYLASAECQQVVAGYGVVFPARRGLAEQVVELHRRQGIDAQAFLTMAADETLPMPVAENGAQIDEIMKGALESVLLGRQRAAPALQDASRRINALQRPGAAARR